MDSERFARIGDVFAHARERLAVRRAEYLDTACGDDVELRAEVEGLLEEDTPENRDAVDRALGDDAALGGRAERSLPSQIGGYRILGLCGSGGMGTVYEAEQNAPFRRVALKVIQQSLQRPDLLRRFRHEANILGRLQHPCIAQVYETGEFDVDGTSRPFFVVEFVDGAPLLEHATRSKLGVDARLELFAQICDAIDYAHQNGVVHRDLKPDNILVVETTESTASSRPGSGRPKVLDFGVAHLADADAQATLATGAGQLLGSVPYMSPEQATGDVAEIDPRSDLYALGVLLFELLTGRLPYDVRGRPLADALRAIQQAEPSRLGTADPGLRGDLETIVGTCLEKDPDRRYGSVFALAEDLRRYRRHEPITARPPSTWYQL